jgi:hypothetical protein
MMDTLRRWLECIIRVGDSTSYDDVLKADTARFKANG